MNKSQFLSNFSLNQPVEYHSEGLERVAGFDRKKLRKAAVIIGCVERENGLNVILTKRALHLRHHPGQISFPGGKQEDNDPGAADTAIREAHEEIGLLPSMIDIIGTLPPLITVSRFDVTPVVAFVSPDYQPVIDQNEVESVFEVPASHLFDIQQLYSQKFKIKGLNHRVFAIPYKHHFIWGVTAQIIQALQLQLFNSNQG
ncbi:CoA pyrophosphatase [Vibrio hannami]|uniref:CoA pyrophosphatase n=1 Tax=Vibrio hannami TaxID=2717094 RepID=UPI00241076B5|nr:CoA pyrophosphatase [Vibrio hannami]MDG3088198.1 CoA pyrophosphatase [Vibrio hannami]